MKSEWKTFLSKPMMNKKKKQQQQLGQKRHCYFCVKSITAIDYKDTNQLRRYMSSYGKIVPRRKSGACSKAQRMLAVAIKRARFMSLLPYVADKNA